ncbi:MAG TPA: zinc-binding dehydrogenase [Aldersonia sp.]
MSTEFDALSQAGFTAGQSLLITGGATAIGLIGIQVAKALGASTVIATTTSEDKKQAILDAGADVAVNVSTEDLVEAVLAATDGNGVDVTLDHVGGEPFEQLPGATKVQGVIVNIGRLSGTRSGIDLDQVSFRRQKLIGTTFSVRTPEELAAVCAAVQPDLTDALAEGRIKAVVDGIYDFDDHLAAATRLRSGETVGKLVLRVTDPETVDLEPAEVANFFGTIRQLGYVVARPRRRDRALGFARGRPVVPHERRPTGQLHLPR